MGRKTRQRFDVESRPDMERYGVKSSTSWILDPAAVDSPSFLVSVVTPDGPGILRAILRELKRPAAVGCDGPYTVTASLSASHSDVGILAIVVRPVQGPGSDGARGRGANGWSRGGPLRRRLQRALTAELGAGVDASALRVDPLGGKNEQALFGSRAFGEMRFGPLVTDQSTREGVPGVIARTLQAFAEALHERDAPIAFIDIGHRWRPPGDGRWATGRPDGLWMRIAYGLPPTPAAPLDIELAAADVATQLGLDAWVDLPDADVPETLGFRPVVAGEPDRHAPEDIRGATVCVVIDGLARTGFAATVLGAAQRHLGARQLLIFGGSAMVLHGRSIVALLTDDAGAEALRVGNRHAEQQIGGFRDVRVAASSESAPARIGPRGTPETFWVSWSRPERAGVILEVLDSVSASLRSIGVDVEPNILFAVSRELRLADSCAGKAKLHVPGLGESEVLFEAIRSALATGDDPWRGGDAVRVTQHEPTRHPWAALDRPVQVEDESDAPLTLFAGDER